MNDDPTISADAMNHDPRTTDPRSPVDGDGVLPRQAVSAAKRSTYLSGDTTPAMDSGRTENHGVLMASTEAPPAGSELEPGVCAKAVSEAEAVSCPVPVRALREDDLVEGGRRLALAHALRRMVDEDGRSQREAARALGVTEKTASIYIRRLRENPEAAADDFAPRKVNCGRRPKQWLEMPEIRAAMAHLVQSNRTATAGSTTEALRLASRRGELRPEVASLVEARLAAGQTPLPPAAMRQLRVSETVVRAYRSPRNAWLDYVSSPGSLQMTVDAESGEERLVQPGERWTIDDGSVNLLCIVPGLERPGDACWDRWGVAVGRFQLLVIVDHRTRMVVGWSFTARPRDSYRAEDIVATFHPAIMEHGAPREMVLEHGVSAAGLVSQTLDALGVRILRASSPHQKVVESVFNCLWTRLSSLPGQVGRFRGEEEAANLMLTRIRSGALDPRGKLIDLPQLLAAIRAAVESHNAATVNSERLGSWVPADFWRAESSRWLRRVAVEDSWMFAPHASRPIKVRGNRVETSWQPMRGWTVKLVFAADWLLDFHGVEVVLRYNAHAPECEAVAILAVDVGTRRKGEVLGRLVQIDRMARMTRRALGYGLDPDIGLAETRAAAQALRRHVAAVRPDGKPGVQSHEIRTGSGNAVTVTTGAAAEAASNIPTNNGRDRCQAPTGEDLGAGPERVGQRSGGSNRATVDPRLAEILAEDDFAEAPAP